MNKKLFTAICLLFSITLATANDETRNSSAAQLIKFLESYHKWTSKIVKKYSTEEEKIYRQSVFFDNQKVINNQNSQPSTTYKLGNNQFSDLTDDEFQQAYLTLKSNRSNSIQEKSEEKNPGLRGQTSTTSIDWRELGALGPIKNQGACTGASWVFSAVGTVEATYFIKNKKSVILSEQQIIDCVNAKTGYRFSFGCTKGDPKEAFEFIDEYGLVEESAYPFTGVQGPCKQFDSTQPTFKAGKLYDIQYKDHPRMKRALLKGPVWISMDGSSMKLYKGGVFNSCVPPEIKETNLGVVLVGIDANSNWIIRNAWGSSWGESGYIRIAAGDTCSVGFEGFFTFARV